MKRYTLGEEIFNSVTHGIGAVFAVLGIFPLLLRALPHGAIAVTAVSIYGASLLILYTMSTLYHAIAAERAKAVFRIFDHATIFLLIAGTYTPYSLLAVRGALGWVIFGAVWGLSAIGILFGALFRERFHKWEMALYILLGWCIVFAAKAVFLNVALPGIVLLLAGGVSYTLGIVFYALKIRYMHSIWHLFVLGGSVLQYFSVLLYVL